MPKRSREELIAAKEAELAALRAGIDKSKQTRHDKLNDVEIPALDERINKLTAQRQAKVDERDLLAREIAESKQAPGPDSTDGASHESTVSVGA